MQITTADLVVLADGLETAISDYETERNDQADRRAVLAKVRAILESSPNRTCPRCGAAEMFWVNR